MIRVPIDADVAPWTIGALEAPSIVRVRVPKSTAKQGIRDISYDQQTGDFLILIGRSTSTGDEPFQLCAWNGSSDNVELLDVTFHRSMKPEGVVAFSSGDESESSDRRRPWWLRRDRLPREGSVEVEVGTRKFLVNPGPAARREVEPVLRHLIGPQADEVEIAGIREPARRIGGVRDRDRHRSNLELFSMFAVTRRTCVEIFVPLRRDLRGAGVQNAVERLIGE